MTRTMKILYTKNQQQFSQEITALLNRFSFIESDLEETVKKIIQRVQKEGDGALLDFSAKFDCVVLKEKDLLVGQDEKIEARKKVKPTEIEVMKKSIVRVREFHRRQKKESWFFTEENNVILGQLITPLERVGLYVPGGKASYPSSVIMGAIPALIAGVKEIIMVSPPGKDKRVNAHTLMAAELVGVDKIYKIGGAQAIAALAFGTKTIPRVQKIVGPGNIYVTLAKKQVFGAVDIDMLAGPSEVLILADKSANPEYIAADLLSQAEHDERAVTMLITPVEALIKKVETCLFRQLEELKRKAIAEESLNNYGYLIHTKNMEEAITLTNDLAAEHLILAVEDPLTLLSCIHNAGSIFLGKFTPETMGDYLAGPNHVLPTSGTARFFSALGVEDFCKRSGFSYFSQKALEELGPAAMAFAELEGLSAHAAAIRKRLSKS